MLNKIIEKFGSNYKVKKAGVTYPCPFHGEKTLGHFNICPKTGMYHCFVCNASGNILSKKELKEFKKVIESPVEDKPVFQQLESHINGYNNFKHYIQKRGIDFNLDLFSLENKFSYSKDKWGNNYMGLINTKSRYTYQTDQNNNKKWKGWVNGSSSQIFSFKAKNFESYNNCFIFEGFEDCLAYIQIYHYFIDFKSTIFVVLFGVCNINQVNFFIPGVNYNVCLDNDKASRDMIKKIPTGCNTNFYSPIDTDCKDYNDLLVKHKDFYNQNDMDIKENNGDIIELLQKRLKFKKSID